MVTYARQFSDENRGTVILSSPGRCQCSLKAQAFDRNAGFIKSGNMPFLPLMMLTGPGQVETRFQQRCDSGALVDRSEKVMTWQKVGNQCCIVNESGH